MHPGRSAFVGGLLVLPFMAANAIVGARVEPFFSLIRPGLHTSAREYGFLAVVLLCLPVGAAIAARPLWQRGPGGFRRVHLANGAIAAVLLVLFVLLTYGLGEETYRCDVLQIPNCD